MRAFKIVTISILILLGLTAHVAPAAAQAGDDFRPAIAGEELEGSEHFLVHYTRSGDDAVPDEDTNGDSVPDFVEGVIQALEYSWQIQIGTFGWAVPPSDDGIGGDARIDIYLQDIMPEGIAGYVETDTASGGDNPNTSERERRAAAAFMGLDNDYLEVLEEFDDPAGPDKLMRSTVAHEFNHILQAGYDNLDQHAWLYESTASWMEDEVYDEVNDNVYYVFDRTDQPELCMVSETTWYANWLFLRLISERRGSQVVRAIWEQSRTLDGFAAIDAALNDPLYTLSEAAADFSIANLLRDYEEGEDYPTVRLTDILGEGTMSPQNGVQSLGASYYEIAGAGPALISLADAEPFMRLMAVGVYGTQADLYGGSDDPQVVIDRDRYDYVYAVVFNSSQILPSENCAYIDYTLEVSSPAQIEATPVQRVWSAANFAPPDTTSDMPDFEYIPPAEAPFRGAEDEIAPDELDVEFETIIPDSLPEGYTFDYAYIMTVEDFAGIEVFYVPGGGPAANFDYLTKDGDWLSIAESAGPYTTVEEWLDDFDYEGPGDLIDVDGTTVLLEDLSKVDSPWYSLTLILDGLFIVVDGNETEEVVIELAQILINESMQDDPDRDEPTPADEAEPEIADEEPDNLGPDALQPPEDDNFIFPAILTGISALCVGLFCLLAAIGGIAGVVIVRRRRRPDV